MWPWPDSRISRRRRIAGVVLASVALASCTAGDNDEPATPTTPPTTLAVEGAWMLRATDPASVMDRISTTIRLEFRADGTFTATDQCNFISSDWARVSPLSVAFADERLTTMDCGETRDVLPWPLGSAQLADSTLLIGVGGDTVFEFEPA